MRRFVCGVLTAAMVCLAGCKSSSTSTTTPTTPSTSGALTVLTFTSIASITMNVGDSRQVKVVALMSDGSNQIITNAATWTSGGTNIVTVDSTGIVTAVGAGTTSILVATGGVTGTVSITVNAASTTTLEFIGTVAGPASFSATADLLASPGARSSGTLYRTVSSFLTSLTATGRYDVPAGVLNVIAGGYTILGTVSGAFITGTVTDTAGNVGSFSGLDGTHVAVTTYCGSYVGGDGTTGPFNLAVSPNGAVAASVGQLSAAGAAAAFTGTMSGGTMSLAAPGVATATGTLVSGVATGTVNAGAATGTFTANVTGCR